MFDLESNPEVESLDKVPEDYRQFYEAKDNKFVLASDDRMRAAIKIVSGQHKALNASRSEAANYKKRAVDMSPLSEYGNTPADVASAVAAKIEAIQKEAASGKVDVAQMKASMETAMQKKLDPYEAKIKSLSGQLEQLLVKNVAAEAITAAKGSAKLLMPHIERCVRCVEEQGEFKVYVVDEKGAHRFSGTVPGAYMTIAELVEEMKADKEYGRMFESEALRGGGTPPAGTSKRPATKGAPTSIDKISAGIGKGQFYRGGNKVSG